MLKFGEFIARHRALILVIGILLLFPAAIGYINTRVNYDILSYLPDDIETMQGQEILKEEFGQGGFSFVMTEGMTEKEIADTADKISKVDHVSDVVCYEKLTDLNVPKEILPQKVYDFFNKGDNTLMAVFFDDTTSADTTLKAIDEMRDITAENCFISGMSAITDDMKHLSDSESIIYAVIAVILTSAVLILTMDSFLIPVFFMLSIGTVDYAILMTTRYRTERADGKDKKEAVQTALGASIRSIITSALGFFAATVGVAVYSEIGMISSLCLLLSRGALISMVVVIGVLPSMFMLFDKLICKTSAGFGQEKKRHIFRTAH